MTKKFWKATFVRMIRTFTEAALSHIGTAALISDVDWLGVLSAGCMGASLSMLMAISTGLPEAGQK